jgi:hypothetical protein
MLSRIFFSPQLPDLLCDTTSLLSNGYGDKVGQSVKLTIRFELVQRSRKHGPVHPFPQLPSLRHAQ